MSRNQKIIVSITGIVLVTLILVGLTYAYFLTKITGNANTKSISVSTANLAIVYEDNSAEILGKDLILEPSGTADNDAIGTKKFTVTNKGNAKTSYVVVIDNVKVTNATDGTTTTFESNDFRYTLTCKEGCNGVLKQNVFPINGGILVENNIDVKEVQSYELKLWYIDTGIDQTKDMNKRFEARVNISDITQVENQYSSSENSLAYNIIENAKNKSNGTELLSRTKTQIADETSYISTQGMHVANKEDGFSNWVNMSYGDTQAEADEGSNKITGSDAVEKCNSVIGKYVSGLGKVKGCTSDGIPIIIGSSESTMSVATDNYGISYYYRGHIDDNFVNFAGMCWRVVRIAGDGSIKIILEDQDELCSETMDGNWNIPTTTGGTIRTGNFGYTEYAAGTLTASDGTQNSNTKYLINYLNGETENATSMATVFKNFQTGPLANYLDKLKAGDWCLDDKAYATSSGNSTPLTDQEILDKQIKDGGYFYYDSYVRLGGETIKEPTLKCNGTNMNKFADNTDMYVGTLTADEIIYAGAKIYVINPDYYLVNDYHRRKLSWFFSLTPYHFGDNGHNFVFRVGNSGRIYNIYVNINNAGLFRPAVQLKSNIQFLGGDGTKENPYEIAS